MELIKQVLEKFVVFNDINVTYEITEDKVIFKRGEVVVSVPFDHIIILGLKTIYSMFTSLDD